MHLTEDHRRFTGPFLPGKRSGQTLGHTRGQPAGKPRGKPVFKKGVP